MPVTPDGIAWARAVDQCEAVDLSGIPTVQEGPPAPSSTNLAEHMISDHNFADSAAMIRRMPAAELASWHARWRAYDACGWPDEQQPAAHDGAPVGEQGQEFDLAVQVAWVSHLHSLAAAPSTIARAVAPLREHAEHAAAVLAGRIGDHSTPSGPPRFP